MIPNGFDHEGMIERARSSEDGEAYFNLLTVERGRLGVSVSVPYGNPVFVLELLVCVLKEGTTVDLDRIYDSLEIAQAAQRQGFGLTSHGDGWIYCHKEVGPAELERQCSMAGRLID
jgi:hypothetical protein